MKKNQLFLTLAHAFLLFVIISCQRNASDVLLNENESGLAATTVNGSAKKPSNSDACNPNAYIVTLESRTHVNQSWEWIWSVQNSNPGNGNDGTIQDLSHWGMQFGGCVSLENIIEAAYSSDAINWTGFDPSYQLDHSQACMTTPVIKFDFGTSGDAKSYYRITFNQDYPVGVASGYYKSGNRTGCCTFTFAGVSCIQDDIIIR